MFYKHPNRSIVSFFIVNKTKRVEYSSAFSFIFFEKIKRPLSKMFSVQMDDIALMSKLFRLVDFNLKIAIQTSREIVCFHINHSLLIFFQKCLIIHAERKGKMKSVNIVSKYHYYYFYDFALFCKNCP